EDGIRDGHVTGVQTCALPISSSRISPILIPGSPLQPTISPHLNPYRIKSKSRWSLLLLSAASLVILFTWSLVSQTFRFLLVACRSEERRVGKECVSWVLG